MAERDEGQQRWDGTLGRNNPLKARENYSGGDGGEKKENTGDTHLVKWRNFASMLRCRMHILVRAEPTSLVAPWIGQWGGKQTNCHLRYKRLALQITDVTLGLEKHDFL